MIEQERAATQLYADSQYRIVDKQPDFNKWRRHLSQHESWLTSIGFHRLATYINETSQSSGYPNTHLVFTGKSYPVQFCITYMTIRRIFPIIGYTVPFPKITGEKIVGISIETLFTNGDVLITMEEDSGCTWPPNYEFQCPDEAESISDFLDFHMNRHEEKVESGCHPVKWLSADQYMDYHKKQHEELAALSIKETEKMFSDCESQY
ncbi:MAG: hypothetical protein AAF571_07660 [Verrucomicrobiota bacterium]